MATIVSDIITHLQAGEAIAIRDAIHIDDVSGKIFKFNATNPAHVFSGIAKEAGVLDGFIRVVQTGRVRGFTGLTAGKLVYASTTVPGGFQLVEPVSTQKTTLGIAKSATELTLNGSLGIKPGGEGGGGGLDAFYTEDMEGLADTTGFSKGNNALFMGGGTMQGTLDLESVSPISDLKSLKYTQAAGSLNDYFASELIDLDLKQRDGTSGMTFYFKYDGNDNDGRFVVYDVTNSREIASEVNFVKLASKATRYSLSFYVPASCTQIRWGYQVEVENVGKILIVDDVEMSTDPFMEGEILDIQSSRITQTATFAAATITGALTASVGGGLYSYSSGTGIYTVLKKSEFKISSSLRAAGAASVQVNVIVDDTARSASTSVAAASQWTTSQFSGILDVGSTFRIDNGLANNTDQQFVSVSATSSTSHILTPSDTFSTDTAPLIYAGSATYTLATLANAPIGTFITFTYAINTNTRTQTNAAPPTQTTSDMNQNGMLIFTRAFNADSTALQPAAIAVQIGKGLKGTSLNLYKSAGKVTSGSLDNSVVSTTLEVGATYSNYNESTGILILDAGVATLSTNTNRNFAFSDVTSQTSGYLTINASRSLPLLAVPVPLVAYLKDIKPSGTAGGTFTSGAWQTRTLNTVEGDGSIVSLSGNQVSIGPGKYEIEAEAVAYQVGNHKAKLYNITTAADAIIGSSENSNSTTPTATRSKVVGTLNLSATQVFELRHQCQTTKASDGFGIASTFAVSEVYSQISIKKIG